MDSWNEHWRHECWLEAFEQTGVDPDEIIHRELPLDKPLPWSHIRCCGTQEFFRAEHGRMMEALRAVEPAG